MTAYSYLKYFLRAGQNSLLPPPLSNVNPIFLQWEVGIRSRQEPWVSLLQPCEGKDPSAWLSESPSHAPLARQTCGHSKAGGAEPLHSWDFGCQVRTFQALLSK